MEVFSSSNSSFSVVNHRLVGDGVIHLECPKNRQGLGSAGYDYFTLHGRYECRIFGKILGEAGCEGFGSRGDRTGRAGDTTGAVYYRGVARGKSSYRGRNELNHYSIGIELDNLGQLRLEGGKFVAECGKEVPSERGVHGGFWRSADVLA